MSDEIKKGYLYFYHRKYGRGRDVITWGCWTFQEVFCRDDGNGIILFSWKTRRYCGTRRKGIKRSRARSESAISRKIFALDHTFVIFGVGLDSFNLLMSSISSRYLVIRLVFWTKKPFGFFAAIESNSRTFRMYRRAQWSRRNVSFSFPLTFSDWIRSLFSVVSECSWTVRTDLLPVFLQTLSSSLRFLAMDLRQGDLNVHQQMCRGVFSGHSGWGYGGTYFAREKREQTSGH